MKRRLRNTTSANTISWSTCDSKVWTRSRMFKARVGAKRSERDSVGTYRPVEEPPVRRTRQRIPHALRGMGARAAGRSGPRACGRRVGNWEEHAGRAPYDGGGPRGCLGGAGAVLRAGAGDPIRGGLWTGQGVAGPAGGEWDGSSSSSGTRPDGSRSEKEVPWDSTRDGEHGRECTSQACRSPSRTRLRHRG